MDAVRWKSGPDLNAVVVDVAFVSGIAAAGFAAGGTAEASGTAGKVSARRSNLATLAGEVCLRGDFGWGREGPEPTHRRVARPPSRALAGLVGAVARVARQQTPLGSSR